MPALGAGIHVFRAANKSWMAGTSGAKAALRAFCPAMTVEKRGENRPLRRAESKAILWPGRSRFRHPARA
jgi:hypothetical protein